MNYKTRLKVDNAVLDIKLKKKEKGTVLSVMGSYYDKETKSQYDGQCIEIFREKFKNNKYMSRLIEIWEKYHLNDLRPGTKRQMKVLKEKNIKGFHESVKYLKEIGLYEDGHRFGYAWHFEEIPKDIIEEIIYLSEKIKRA